MQHEMQHKRKITLENQGLSSADNRTRTCTVAQRHLKPPRLPIPPYPHKKRSASAFLSHYKVSLLQLSSSFQPFFSRFSFRRTAHREHQALRSLGAAGSLRQLTDERRRICKRRRTIRHSVRDLFESGICRTSLLGQNASRTALQRLSQILCERGRRLTETPCRPQTAQSLMLTAPLSPFHFRDF